MFSHKSRKWWMGFSMIWIILFHTWEMEGGLKGYCDISFFDFFFSKGYLGVDVFFFLSVYGCSCSLRKHSLKKFYQNRFLRLFPIYPLYTLILVIIVAQYYGQPSWLMFVKQLTGLSIFTISHLHIEWYLPAIIIIYLLFPLIFKFCEVLQRNRCMFCITLLLFSLFVFVIDHVFISDFAYRIPIIIMGTISFFLLDEGSEQRLLVYYLIGATISFVMIKSVTLSCSLIVPLLLLAYSKSSIVLPFNRFFSFVGSHSLEIYLAQNLALDHFMSHTSILNPFVKFPICFLIIALGSCLLYYVQSVSMKLLMAK